MVSLHVCCWSGTHGARIVFLQDPARLGEMPLVPLELHSVDSDESVIVGTSQVAIVNANKAKANTQTHHFLSDTSRNKSVSQQCMARAADSVDESKKVSNEGTNSTGLN